MELTKQEERLIGTIRAVDQVNPMGAEGHSSEHLMEPMQLLADGWLKDAKEAHERFLEESKSDRFVDLAYYKAWRKNDGTRTDIHGKPVLKRFGDDQEISAPEISEPERPTEKFVDEDEIPGPDKPIEEWTEEELEEYHAYLWDNAEPGIMEYAVKYFTESEENIEIAVRVIEAIKQKCDDDAAKEGLRSVFETDPARELLRTTCKWP